MAFERTWPAVAPRLLTATGSTTGLIQVSDTRGFKVKGKAVLQSVTKAATAVEVKRVLSDTQMIIGAVGTPITDRSFDASVFTTADNAFIFAAEQEKVKVPQIDREHATYDQEPTNAWRNVLVDQLGRYYETSNPLPVQLSDGSINIGTVQAQLEVFLTHKDNDPNAGEIHDSVRIGDGTYEAGVTDNNELKVSDAEAIAGLTQLDSDLLNFKEANHEDLQLVQEKLDTLHVDLTEIVSIGGFENFFAVLAAARWMELANYDEVIPTYSEGNTVLTLSYREDGIMIGEAVVTFNSGTAWTIKLNRYIIDDNGMQLFDDDDLALNLD